MSAKIQIKMVDESGIHLGTLTILLKLHKGITRAEAIRQIKENLKRCGKLMRYSAS